MTTEDPIRSLDLLPGDYQNDPSGENDDAALATTVPNAALAALRKTISSTVLNLPATTDGDGTTNLASATPEAALAARRRIRSTVLNLAAAADSDDTTHLAPSVPETVLAARRRIRSTVLNLATTDGGGAAALAPAVPEAALAARRWMIRSAVLNLAAPADVPTHCVAARSANMSLRGG